MQRLVAIAGDYYVIAWQINLFAQNVAVFVSRLSIKRWRMWVEESRRALGHFPSARSLDACLPTCRAFIRSGANSLRHRLCAKIIGDSVPLYRMRTRILPDHRLTVAR